MKNVIIDSYKEITSEEYFAKTPGAPWTEAEKAEFLNKNTNVIYGYCRYTIELIDANNLTMEGSKPAYQELNGNTFKSEAVFTMDKTTKEINFATSYGFGNQTSDEIENLIKNYILTSFGPKNNMKSVTVDSYKELTPEEYFAKTPGAPLTEAEKTEFLNKNTNVMYGYCKYTIELIDANNLTMEGSKPAYQEMNGNAFKSEAIFTMNKTTKEINFATSYGFGN